MPKKLIDGAVRGDVWRCNPFAIRVATDPDHPLYDERNELPLDDSLARNVAANGVLQPIIVARDDDDAVWVVDGRQRLKAACAVRDEQERQGCAEKLLLRVPCVLRRGDDRRLYGALVSANEFRRDDTILGKARKAQRMADLGASVDDIAESFGCGRDTIKNWVALLGASAPVRRAVEADKIPPTAGYRLARLDGAAAQKQALDELLIDGPKRGAARRATAKVKASKATKAPKTKTEKPKLGRATTKLMRLAKRMEKHCAEQTTVEAKRAADFCSLALRSAIAELIGSGDLR